MVRSILKLSIANEHQQSFCVPSPKRKGGIGNARPSGGAGDRRRSNLALASSSHVGVVRREGGGSGGSGGALVALQAPHSIGGATVAQRPMLPKATSVPGVDPKPSGASNAARASRARSVEVGGEGSLTALPKCDPCQKSSSADGALPTAFAFPGGSSGSSRLSVAVPDLSWISNPIGDETLGTNGANSPRSHAGTAAADSAAHLAHSSTAHVEVTAGGHAHDCSFGGFAQSTERTASNAAGKAGGANLALQAAGPLEEHADLAIGSHDDNALSSHAGEVHGASLDHAWHEVSIMCVEDAMDKR